MDMKLNKHSKKNYITLEDNLLAVIVWEKITPKTVKFKKQLDRKVKLNTIQPSNGTNFTLREAFEYIDKYKMTPSKFWNLVTDPKLNPKHQIG